MIHKMIKSMKLFYQTIFTISISITISITISINTLITNYQKELTSVLGNWSLKIDHFCIFYQFVIYPFGKNSKHSNEPSAVAAITVFASGENLTQVTYP